MSHRPSAHRGDHDAAGALLPVRRTARRLPGLLGAIVAVSLAAGCAAPGPEPAAYVPPALADIPGAIPAIASFGISGRAVNKDLQEKADKGDKWKDAPHGGTPCCSGKGGVKGSVDPSGYGGTENGAYK